MGGFPKKIKVINVKRKKYKMRFKRVCIKCLREFRPKGRFQKMCEFCQKNVRHENFIKMISFRKARCIKV